MVRRLTLKDATMINLRSISHCFGRWKSSLPAKLFLKRPRKRIFTILVIIVLAVLKLITWHVSLTPFYQNIPATQHVPIETPEETEIYLIGDKTWPELPYEGKRSDKYKEFRAFTLGYFHEISGKFQQTRFQCSSLFAGDPKHVQRTASIAKILAGLEEIRYGGSANVAKVKARNAIPPPPKRLLRKVTKWPAWEFWKLTNEWYLRATSNCEKFKRNRGYITSPLSREEENFPIAFSLLVYKDIEMVERLLRMVYRPQNSYCIHVDMNASPEFYEALKALASCFPENVRIPSHRIPVLWGTYTTVEPELVCMHNLWQMDMDIAPAATKPVNSSRYNAKVAAKFKDTIRVKDSAKVNDKVGVKDTTNGRKKSKWKYLINLTGQEFPLKTNYEMVKILKAFNGANNEEGTLNRADKFRWASKPPHGIKPIKGAVHTIINRATVDFILHDPKSLDFLEWLRDTEFPDETLFASINYNPHLGIPGSYSGQNMENVTAFARFKKWNWRLDYAGCPSRLIVRGVCILST
ncbi:beta-1,3-galactosyl-O-glycosyl-glycoprotein beta-1,6-N-acetylglucosaminyltransferase 3-like, partial [Elysia marginata]